MILLRKFSLHPNLHLPFLLICASKREILVVLVSRKGKKEQKRLLLWVTKIATLLFSFSFSFLFFFSFVILSYGLLRDPFICRHVDSRFSCIKLLFKFNETLVNYFLCTCLDGPIQD
jgi:hypothetical protein